MTMNAKYKRYVALGESFGAFIKNARWKATDLFRPKSPPSETYWTWRDLPGQS